MSDHDELNRRDFIVTTAGVAGGVTALAGMVVAPAQAQTPPPPGFADQDPINQYWNKQLRDIVSVDLGKDAPELADDAVKERHRIYCHLLMKLIVRFWNGNKRGPVGSYPLRERQIEAQLAQGKRYRGDMIANPEGVNWDRYIGHNIACLAVDGNGEIIDFDFNHNDFFRSSAEHAESRLVRRLFSLADVRDSRRTAQRIGDKSRAFSIAVDRSGEIVFNDVTLYTSLESCAQCSGVMTLGGVKQIIYLQNDFTQYMVGNIMYNLANRNGKFPGAPVPIPASQVGLPQFKLLNDANLTFAKNIVDAGSRNDLSQAFFVSQDGSSVKDFAPSVTSFLCTDVAHDIFRTGGQALDTTTLNFPERRHPNDPNHPEILTNAQCLKEAQDFYKYADIEGYRGSPHKL
jgi:tRNA(Arg) A34 adenosine deaminase TadA